MKPKHSTLMAVLVALMLVPVACKKPSGDKPESSGTAPKAAELPPLETRQGGVRQEFTRNWGPEQNLYFIEADAVRRVTMEGVVTTLARGFRGPKDADLPIAIPFVLSVSPGAVPGETVEGRGLASFNAEARNAPNASRITKHP